MSRQFRWIETLLLLIACAGCATVQKPGEIVLWKNGAPGAVNRDSPEVVGERNEPNSAYVEAVTFKTISNVNNPSIIPYLPDPAKATGAAVIILPGGGHQFLAIGHEGYPEAQAFAGHGIAAFILKYRLAKETGSTYTVEKDALMDLQRAIRMVRYNAADWHIDPDRVGIMGFSAGGQLAFLGATKFADPVKGSDDEVDKENCRPDFAALMYPGGIDNVKELTLPANMPPEFLACAYNDKPQTSASVVALYLKMKTQGTPAELHIYGSGGHGFGIRPASTRPVNQWPNIFMDWLGDIGMMGRK